jgi:predicted hydrocarbon binding protein
MPEIHVKAVPVNGLYEFVAGELTAGQLRAVLDHMGDAARWFNGHLLAHEIVPLTAVNRFTELAAEAKKEPVKAFGRRAGRYGAELGLKSVYKFILAMASIDYVIRKAPFMWTRVYDGGRLEVESAPNRGKVHVLDFPGSAAGCARITGWFEVVLERAGGKDVRNVHTSCVAEGGPECLWDVSWR